MQTRFLALLSAAALLLVFSSCSKTNKQGRYVPASAAFVMHVNGTTLMKKLPWSEVQKGSMFTETLADTSVPAFAKAIMNDPQNTGADLSGDVEVFYVKDSTGSYAAIEGGVSNETKFKTFLTDALPAGKSTAQGGHTVYNADKSAISYDGSRFAAVFDMGETPTPDMFNDSTLTPKTIAPRSMTPASEQLFNLAENASLAGNEHFTELMKTSGDMHFWFNAENLAPSGKLGAMTAMIHTEKLTEGAVTTGVVNFDNGRITIDSKSYVSKEMASLFSKYSSSDFDHSMVKAIPSKNVAGLFVLRFKPEGLREFLRLMNLDGLFNVGTQQFGFTLDDFIKANKGDIMMAVTDVNDSTSKFGMKFIFSASVADKPSFDKLIAAGEKAGAGLFPNPAGGNPVLSYSRNNNYFVLSDDKVTADAFLTGNANNDAPFLTRIAGGPMGAYVNFQYILGTMKPSTDTINAAMHEASVRLWDDMVMNGGNYKDGSFTQHVEINMLDKNTNSLKQLADYTNTMHTLQKKKSDQMRAMWSQDTTTVIAAPDLSGAAH